MAALAILFLMATMFFTSIFTNGQPDAAAEPGIPRPGAPAVTAPSLGSLKAKWKAPAPDLTGYDTQYREEPGGDWTPPSPQGPISLAVIPGLKPATTYEVRVRARSGQEVSQWSPGGSGTTKPQILQPDNRTFQKENGATTFLNRFIVGVAGEFSSQKAQDIADRHGAVLANEMKLVRMISLRTNFDTREEHEQFLLNLNSDPDVRFAEADGLVGIPGKP